MDAASIRRQATPLAVLIGIALFTLLPANPQPVQAGTARVIEPHADSARNDLPALSQIPWPKGTALIPLENVEGVLLIPAAFVGEAGRDTTGLLALDTGAGYLALDTRLARVLGIADSTEEPAGVRLAARPLPELRIGPIEFSRVSPVLTFDGEIVRRVTDRPVLGLLGQRPLEDRVVWIDYRERVLVLAPGGMAAEPDADRDRADAEHPALAPGTERDHTDAEHPALAPDEEAGARLSRRALGDALGANAVAVPFRMVGDGKMLVEARVSAPDSSRWSASLTLIVDTGATRSVLFEEALATHVGYADQWPSMRGLSAPTLIGTSDARMVRIPRLAVPAVGGEVTVSEIDVAVLRSELMGVLSRAVGESVDGLLGYNFLKQFRLGIDYAHRVIWLDAVPPGWDDRPYEYSHVGLQIERWDGAARVVAVVEHSPADDAGIAAGDELVAVDGERAGALDIVTLARRLEGAPRSRITLTMRRGARERTYRLVRRRLL
ncbi:MAG: hypothetical protein A2W00_01885 [Candidatus Eisenbacteria bacterium RBG_16_71_46]|nr:MAG: hypothetical protein A2W00_01885 [Candidatus Eisenbacteria bacterium RBG_16_71_46]